MAHEALGQRHSISHPVLRASMPPASSTSSEPGPSYSSPLPLDEDSQPVDSGPRERHRGRKRSFLEIFREDMAREEPGKRPDREQQMRGLTEF